MKVYFAYTIIVTAGYKAKYYKRLFRNHSFILHVCSECGM